MGRAVRAAVAVAALCMVAAGCSAPGSSVAAPGSSSSPTPTVVVGPSPTTAPGGPVQPDQPPGGVPRCVTADLKGTLGPGDAGAGSVFRPLLLTNASSRTCELVGFPGVSYVTGDDGHQVGPAAEMDGPRGPQVNLAPGKAASAELRLVNVDNFDAAACRPVEVRGLRVYPPGDTAALFVPAEGRACSATPPQPQLFVQTVKPAGAS